MSYEDQQRTYYTQEIESALPNQNAIGMDMSAIRSALSSTSTTDTLTPSKFVSEFGARSNVNKMEAACRATPYPGTSMRPDPTSRTGCGWWFGTDVNNTSTGIGAYGTRKGPMNPNLDTQIGPGKWVWDPQEAYRLEGMRAATNVRSCKDLAFVKFPNIGWCPSTNAGVLTDGNGHPAFPTFAGGDCPGSTIIMSADSCLVEQSQGPGPGPGQSPSVSTLCTPDQFGSLSPACLSSLTKMGGCGNGTLAQVLAHGDYAGTSDTFNSANKILQERGFSLHPGIINDGKMSIDNMWSSLNGLKALTVSSGSGSGRERGAALNLCYGTPFEPCALSASDRKPFDPTCIIQTALGMGYNPNGKFLSTSTGMDYLNQFATWGELVENLMGWKRVADTETNPQKQADAIQKVYGMTVIVPKHGCNVVGVFMYRYFYSTGDISSLFPLKGPQTHFLGRYILKNGFPQQGYTIQELTPAGGFHLESQRMVTQFVPKIGGQYQFFATADDFTRLQIDGRNILEARYNSGGSQSQIVSLVAGQSYKFTVDLWNTGGPWSFSLRMTINGNQWTPIPADQLFMPQDRRLPMLELAFNTMTVGTRTISDTTGVIQNWRLSPSSSIGTLNGKQCLVVSGPGSNVNNGAQYLQGVRLRSMKSFTMMVQISTLDYGISPSIVSFNNLPSTNITSPTLGDSNSRPYSYNERTDDFSLLVSGNNVYPYGMQPQIGPTSFKNVLNSSIMPYSKGQWTHIAFVWDENGGGATMYVNGKSGNHFSLQQPYDVKQIMENICIGCNFNENWTGGIAWFRAFDYALNTESIKLDSMNQPEIQIYNLAGGHSSYMHPDTVPITSISSLNGEKVYLAYDGTYTRILTASGVSKYCHGDGQSTFGAQMWNTYLSAAGQFKLV